MDCRLIARELCVISAVGVVLLGCEKPRQEPPPQEGLQIEIEREPKEDGGRIKVKVNKPANEDAEPAKDDDDR